MTLYIALCDDEIEDLKSEEALIKSVLPGDIDWKIDTFSSSNEMLASGRIHQMVFLDVEMDGINGIEAAEKIHQKNPHCLIFFVTHHEDYMDEALNKHAFRFWTKPISKTRLIYGIQSAVREIQTYRKVITVTVAKNIVKIPLTDIVCLYHHDRFTYIITSKQEYRTYDAFHAVTKQLDAGCFAETHGSCYVNLNYVTEYSKTKVKCECEGKQYLLDISKRKYASFEMKFKEWSCGLQ